jgi:hypothetical protein
VFSPGIWWIIADMNERGAVICISQRPQRKAPLQIDLTLQEAPPHRELLRQTQGVQAHAVPTRDFFACAANMRNVCQAIRQDKNL